MAPSKMTPLEVIGAIFLLLLSVVYLPVYMIAHLLIHILYLPRTLHRYIFHPSNVLKRRYWAKDAYALVTGSTDGAGKGFAEQFAARGWNVIIHGRSPDKINGVISSLQSLYPNQVFLPLCLDCTEDDLPTKLPAAFKAFKGLDVRVLVNNVAYLHPCAGFEELPIKMVDNVLRTNAIFPTFITHCMLNFGKVTADTPSVAPSPPTKSAGSTSLDDSNQAVNPNWHHEDSPLRLIISIGSVGSLYASSRVTPYAPSKVYLNALSSYLRFSLQSKEIEVMSVQTGALDTNMWPGRRTLIMILQPNEFASLVLNKVGLSRIGHGWGWWGWKALGLGVDDHTFGGTGLWVHWGHQTMTFMQGLLPADVWCVMGNFLIAKLGVTPLTNPLLAV